MRHPNSPGAIFEAMEKHVAPKEVKITELNPQAEPERPAPLCVTAMKTVASLMSTAAFISHADEREIPITAGEVSIIGGPDFQQRFAAAPRSRLRVPESLSGKLRIIAKVAGKHEVVLSRGEVIVFDPEVGANCEIMLIAGRAVPIGLYKATFQYEDLP